MVSPTLYGMKPPKGALVGGVYGKAHVLFYINTYVGSLRGGVIYFRRWTGRYPPEGISNGGDSRKARAMGAESCISNVVRDETPRKAFRMEGITGRRTCYVYVGSLSE